jgi:hypothetical protein
MIGVGIECAKQVDRAIECPEDARMVGPSWLASCSLTGQQISAASPWDQRPGALMKVVERGLGQDFGQRNAAGKF